MRKALVVGIDYYKTIQGLNGAVKDALSVSEALERNADGTLNFAQPRLLTATSPECTVSRANLRNAVQDLFRDDAEIALFYFAGHGYIDSVGGYLCASDAQDGHDGLALNEVLQFASASKAKNKMIILDSCHSGTAGDRLTDEAVAEIKDGVTILTASTATQSAMEADGAGVFTGLLVDALEGSAANLLGDVTPGSVYAHIDQSLGNWAQRPVFKTNVKTFVSLRRAEAPIELADLQKVTILFTRPATKLPLDPSYEPERNDVEDPAIPVPDPAKNEDFRVLQRLASVGLVRPDGAEHMWHAAMQSKACRLTVLGRHYWNLVNQKLL